MTFAVFSDRSAPPDPRKAAKGLLARVIAAQHTPPEALADVIGTHAGHLDALPDLALVAVPVDESLPIALDTIVRSAGSQGANIRAARSVTFVRYSGPPRADHGQVWSAAIAVAIIADAPGDRVFDLSTLRASTPGEWRAALTTPDWIDRQIRLDAEQVDGETIVFRTRGLAKLGLPDLERGGVPRATARQAFEHFQSVYRALRAHGYAQPGDRLGTQAPLTLQPCSGPPERYDHECVALTPDPQ